jgi:hypothetical protein
VRKTEIETETRQVSKFALRAEGKGRCYVPLVASVFGSREVVQSFFLRHAAPDFVTFTGDSGQPGSG